MSQETKCVVIEGLSQVPLPLQLDMTDSSQVIGLVRVLTEETVQENPDYAGVIICGSVSRGNASNGESDLDLYHVINNWNTRQLEAGMKKLDVVFEVGYGVRTDRNGGIDLERLRKEASWGKIVGIKVIDQDSVVVIPDDSVRLELTELLDLDNRRPAGMGRPKLVRVSNDEPLSLHVGELQMVVESKVLKF